MTTIVVLIILAIVVGLLLRSLSKGQVRVVLEDYEARLKPPLGSSVEGLGKAERERYKDGEEEFELKLHQLGLPNGSTVEVFLRDASIGSANVTDGRGVFRITSKTGSRVPEVSAGDVIEVHLQGAVILRGTFHRD